MDIVRRLGASVEYILFDFEADWLLSAPGIEAIRRSPA